MKRAALVLVAASALVRSETEAQQKSPLPPTLPTVEVSVARDGARSPLDLPFSISSVQPDSARPGQRRLALDELLFGVPGLTVANRNNPTQDPRISIRGFGARSAFGVRGVRILRDGVPLTLADGQTPTDYLDLESVGRIDVLRGSAAALYGSSAGGVVDVRTSDAPRDVLAGRVTAQMGSYDLSKFSAAGGGRSAGGSFRYQGDISRTEQSGFRRHARHEVTSGSARLALVRDSLDVALTYTGFDMPVAENPGALTRSQMRSDPRMADFPQVRRAARKAVGQSQLGVSATRRLGAGEVSALAHAGWRTLDNPLTFAIVDVDRVTYGAAVRGTLPIRLFGTTHRLSAGADAQLQDDDRLNFQNCNDTIPLTTPTAACPVPGQERGIVTLDQRERVTSVGPYVRAELELGSRFRLSLGARADYAKFRVDDHLISATNADDSGERTLWAVSPMLGVVARIGALHAAHVTVSSAFETPTATELANQPDGSAGINPELDPQYATTAEVGLKGFLFSRLRYDASLFATRVRDELIPFEIPNGGGRRYFRNAGRTRRRGGELGVAAALGSVELGAAYSYSDFEFTRYRLANIEYAGRRIPGVPVQQLEGHTTWRWRQAFATVEGRTSSSVLVDDANSTRAAGYELLNLRLGATNIGGRAHLSPFAGVHNVFDRRYAGAVVVNAAQEKYYEPAPGRTAYVGVTVGVGR